MGPWLSRLTRWWELARVAQNQGLQVARHTAPSIGGLLLGHLPDIVRDDEISPPLLGFIGSFVLSHYERI
jgi:hypothetical protein